MGRFICIFYVIGIFLFSMTINASERQLKKTGPSTFTIVKASSSSNSADASSQSTVLDIPSLVIHKRSDWIDVTKDVFPSAKGDGKSDDTKAIQAALDLLKTDNTKSGIYFPKGIFLISDTLTIGGGLSGKKIIGQGRDTTIKWTGSARKPMLRSLGAAYTSYIGLTWDGSDMATIGILHHSKTVFETFLEHKHEAFKNLTQAGIEVYGGSSSGDLAAAEVLVENCLFDHTHYGLNIGTDMYNAYDWVIDRCEIRNNTIGIRAPKGQFFVYNTHFYNNAKTDILAQNGAYIRRTTSEKSFMFYKDTTSTSSGQLTTFEDVHIDGWTNPSGIAIDYGSRGPMMLFNSSFSNSPKPSIAPVNIHGRSFTWTQHVTLSNNHFDVGKPVVDLSRAAIFVDIPPLEGGSVISSASTTFLDATPIIEGPIIEVTGFNDAMSIQQAVDQAALANNGSIVYMPAKHYYIDKTINIHGENYTIEGAGLSSIYDFKNGNSQDIFFHLNHANNILIKDMRLTLKHGETGVLQDTDGNNTFDRLLTKDALYNEDKILFRFSDLTAATTILLKNNRGKVTVENSGNADIFAKMHLGNLHIKGKKGSGMLGFRWLSSRNMQIDSSRSIVIGDFYTEQAERIFDFNGNKTDDAGRITIGGLKRVHSWNKISTKYLQIDNYLGDIIFMQGSIDKRTVGTTDKIIFSQTSNSYNDVNIILWGIGIINNVNNPEELPYQINIKKGNVFIEQSTIVVDSDNNKYDIPNSKTISSKEITMMQNALNDMKMLGNFDISHR